MHPAVFIQLAKIHERELARQAARARFRPRRHRLCVRAHR
jgi:hypothetical protein